ncbi:MAG: 50S ribosomal protein L16 [Myxococcales bacterium]|nr:50S ribosomal protein L16 [Myxococcales bacterium]
MLQPARTKYRKMHKGRTPGRAFRGNKLAFGEFGLMTLQPGWITSRQIEAARIAMSRHIKRGGKIWIRIFPDKPITKKPAETRMGTGKGGVEYYVAVVKPGRILYEMDGMQQDLAKSAFALAAAKLPVMTRMVLRSEQSL